jgi:hypothetical protein
MKTGCLILGFVLTGDADAGQILGNAIAHEIGHLLLNNQSHSASGIMRGDWNLWDLRNASYGYLLFTPQQAQAIQQEARRRWSSWDVCTIATLRGLW